MGEIKAGAFITFIVAVIAQPWIPVPQVEDKRQSDVREESSPEFCPYRAKTFGTVSRGVAPGCHILPRWGSKTRGL